MSSYRPNQWLLIVFFCSCIFPCTFFFCSCIFSLHRYIYTYTARSLPFGVGRFNSYYLLRSRHTSFSSFTRNHAFLNLLIAGSLVFVFLQNVLNLVLLVSHFSPCKPSTFFLVSSILPFILYNLPFLTLLHLLSRLLSPHQLSIAGLNLAFLLKIGQH